MEIMQIRAFSKHSYEKTKANPQFIFTGSFAHFSKFLSRYIYLDLGFRSICLHPCKECNVSCFGDREFYHISEGYSIKGIYIQRLRKSSFQRTILPVCYTKSSFQPAKSERARQKCIKDTLTIFPFLIYSANIDSNPFSSSRTLLFFVQPLFAH